MVSTNSIVQLVEKAAESYPNQTAVSFKNEVITYIELNKKANQYALFFKEMGISKGDYICLKATKSIDYIVALLGVLKVGAAYIPVNIDTPNQSLLSILDSAKPKLFITENDDDLSDAESVLKLTLNEIARKSKHCDNRNINAQIRKDDIAYIIYTSGTTGLPKGVMVSHDNLLSTYKSWEQVFVLSHTDVHLQMAQTSFDVFTGDVVRALCSGAKLVLCDKKTLLDTQHLYQLIINSKITCAEFVPAVLRRLFTYIQQNHFLLNLRLLICGSDVWTMKEYRWVKVLCSKNTRVINTYGLTEATIDSSWYEEGEQFLSDIQNVPIGIPFPHVKLYVFNKEGRLSKVGEIGELFISGCGVSKGYLGQQELTKERFVTDLLPNEEVLYRTGDCAKTLSNGTVEFLGRNQSHIKIDGKRVELLSLESVINQHTKVSTCLVYAKEVSHHKYQLECMIVADDTTVTFNEIQTHVTKFFPKHYCLQKIFLIESLGLTANGKINRNQDEQNIIYELSRNFEPVINDIEQQIYLMWKQILGAGGFGRKCDFFELGGSSLQFIELIVSVNKHFSTALACCELSPTIDVIAHHVQKQIIQTV